MYEQPDMDMDPFAALVYIMHERSTGIIITTIIR